MLYLRPEKHKSVFMKKILDQNQGLIAPLGYVSPLCNVIRISNEGVLCNSLVGARAGFKSDDFSGEEANPEW